MPSPRLQQQFIRLWQHHQGKEAETTLQELANILHCSKRHIRSLLNNMQKAGWLQWQAESGRGKRSQLNFLRDGRELQQQRAEELLEQQNIEKLVQLVDDKDAVRQMVLSQIERRFRQGKNLLRILYYRPFLNLLPGSPLRRSEIHLVRQIFNSLTRINEENGEPEADLAHHWQQISPNHWRFYLRPAIHFHHGRELQMADVIASIQRLSNQPLFSHIEKVTTPTPHVIDIFLSEPDHWLPLLIGSPHAMILPQEWHQLPNFARMPVGTGPYQVVKNSSQKLQIRAFDNYFGFRALIDEVNIWVLPELAEKLVCTTLHLESDSTGNNSLESRIEEGCYFLLHDQRSDKCKREDVRQWLCSLLTPINLLAHCDPFYQRHWSPAYGLLLRWHHSKLVAELDKPEDITHLTVTLYHQHHEYHTISQILQTILTKCRVELKINIVDYDTWFNGNAESDLWLATANFYNPLEFSLFATLYEMPLLKKCLGDNLDEEISQWRRQELSLEEWCKKIVDKHWLYPLFHHWLELQGQRSMRGVKMNTFGWFDFKSAWFNPYEG
ncbi:HTH-type transcriptional regulator SgrR [Photorhabdus heterorhabditis]|uniref:HTH-type transcriptional regulator SgrR n=1 Tax=Photorhabdus heterorhabditis TaxID=880156 RepID=A0A5B0X6P6_9GAMM|nr:HTH-type transcriptional regulator SgrR [Photorhabdus heterorhabditis]KAA1194946.1 HTH-type transcriptional regulator SgrR [Photorhabdus heterorhabditis]KOY61148.1 transcriptional regulator [Photorhabdus heterorhabditis]MBS9442347.1 transcriptional regulator SgrR [Photorhabdus heterorhabditis]